MNGEKIKEIFKDFEKCTLLVIGDLMVDKYIIGKTDRISPEAPVPIVEIEETFRIMGGSGNVVSNIISLGGNVIPCGVIGDDEDGDFVSSEINKLCKLNKIIVDGSRSTTTKTRIFSEHQQMLRVDNESRKPVEQIYRSSIFKFIEEYKYSYSGVILSDYEKGLLDYDLIQNIISFCHDCDTPIFVDPKGDYHKYQKADFMTPNLKELSIMTKMKVNTDSEIYEAGMKLYDDLELNGLIVTRGKDGISVIRNDGHKMIKLPTMAKEVFDVSGAGDSVIATFALSYLSGLSMEESAELANLSAGVVVGKVGTATATLDEILEIM